MKEKLYLILSLFACAILLAGCPHFGNLYEEDLENGYVVWATDVMKEAAVFKRDKRGSGGVEVVPSVVFAYGWNNEFILAKQHPLNTMDMEVNTSITSWYIVEVASGDVHGSLSEDEFNNLKTELKVPAEISFKTLMSFKTNR